MPAVPLSSAEMLEQEYEYFHGPLGDLEWRFVAGDLRDLPQLLARLQLKADAEPGCYWQLRSRLTSAIDVQSIVAALNGCLAEQGLLSDLMGDPRFASRLLGPQGAQVLRKLVRIPKARRLLLSHPETRRRIFTDAALLNAFVDRSAGLRHLRSDDLIARCVEVYPELLSTIGDEPRLEQHLLENESSRERLASLFKVGASSTFSRAFARLSAPPMIVSKWFGSGARQGISSLSAYAANSIALLDALNTGRLPESVSTEPIPAPLLGHFNTLLIELAYREHVGDSHDMRAVYRKIHERDVAAVCFSGGGIRSATFNLGVLQGLADRGVLSRVHYISTVSGGGYIGSWLSSWMRRHHDGPWGVVADMSGRPADATSGTAAVPPNDPLDPEPAPIRHLRQYSSYLAPRNGVLSTDTWTLFSTYLRNLILNWTMLIPALAAALTVPRILEAFTSTALHTGAYSLIAEVGGGVLGLISALLVGALRPCVDKPLGRPLTNAEIRGRRILNLAWIVPLYITGCCFTVFWAALGAPRSVLYVLKTPFGTIDPRTWVGLAILFAASNALGAVIYALRRMMVKVTVQGMTPAHRLSSALRQLFTAETGGDIVREAAAAVVSGAAGAVLLVVMFNVLFDPTTLASMSNIRIESYVSQAAPLFLLAFFFEATLLAGLRTYSSSDNDREWWARSAAWLFLIGTAHAVASLCVLVLPILILQLPQILIPLGGISGAVSWVLARSGKTAANAKEGEATKASRRTALIMKGAAIVCLLCVIGGISLITTSALVRIPEIKGLYQQSDYTEIARLLSWSAPAEARRHIFILRETPAAVLFRFMVVTLGLALLMSRFLNVNTYSMHAMYRNRLIRAYLGASRWTRRPDPFTGFDSQDNLRMWQLRPELLWGASFADFDEFLRRLANDDHLFNQLPENTRGNVLHYLARRGDANRGDVQAEVVDAVNNRMLHHDIVHNIDAPCSIELLRRNRSYFDQERYKGTLRATVAVEERESGEGEQSPIPPLQRPPLHIVNTALNLVGGENLAWQERKADSFTFSMLHAGNRRLGYRDSHCYGGPGGISLGTAMAISGAAVSPNMGYNSSPIVTFLMTIFNARLGWWLGNPGDAGEKTYTAPGPKDSLFTIVDEALGRTTDTHPYVFLSDGGHFDNLGVYEMVLRRCRYIIACDASADRKYAFGDLANAVRKIRVDFGVPIEFLSAIYIGPQEQGRLGKYCALANIRYDLVDGDVKPGRLLYIKPAVYDDCPPDVKNYEKESDGFPHESTADQFFTESQFESYRALGRHMVDQMVIDQDRNDWRADSIEAFLDRAGDYLDGKLAQAELAKQV
jgi:hypothetical protein